MTRNDRVTIRANPIRSEPMRAEIQAAADDINKSLALLRRHL
jgi:hypothetical protein